MRLSQLPSRKKKPKNCEKCSLIKIAESCLVRKRRNSVCIIYSSSMPLGKNSNGIPIKLFSLVFGGLVIIWDRGGAGRPFLVWLTSCLRYGDPLFWSLWPLTSRVTFSRAASLPALLIWGLVLPSVCLCFWVCVCVCVIYSLLVCFPYTIFCPEADLQQMAIICNSGWQWLTVPAFVPDTSRQSRCCEIHPYGTPRKSKAL